MMQLTQSAHPSSSEVVCPQGALETRGYQVLRDFYRACAGSKREPIEDGVHIGPVEVTSDVKSAMHIFHHASGFAVLVTQIGRGATRGVIKELRRIAETVLPEAKRDLENRFIACELSAIEFSDFLDRIEHEASCKELARFTESGGTSSLTGATFFSERPFKLLSKSPLNNLILDNSIKVGEMFSTQRLVELSPQVTPEARAFWLARLVNDGIFVQAMDDHYLRTQIVVMGRGEFGDRVRRAGPRS